MKLIAKAAKEVSVEIKQDLEDPGSNFKSSWEIFKSVKALLSSLENCYVNPRFWYIEKYKTKSNKAKLFGPTKIHISQLQISIFPIPILFTTSRKNS